MNKIVSEDIDFISSVDLPWQELKNKTILITGGGGFLASYLLKAIITASRKKDLNIKILCISRKDKKALSRLAEYITAPEIMFIRHDIGIQLPDDLPRSDIIIHSASQASPKYYWTDPVGTILPNSVGTANLLNYAVRSRSEKFLFFSSGEVYGIPLHPEKPIQEDNYGYVNPMDVRSCYAESKRIGEAMCTSWAHQYDLHTVIVRPFHTYGPGISFDDGRVFADFVADIVANRDIQMKSEGSALRAFCYITDATVGFLKVLFLGKKSEAYNVGNPSAEISIRDLAYTMSDLFPDRQVSVQINIPNTTTQKNPINRACPSIEKIQSLGWMPTTNIEDGFRRTIQSFL